MSSLHSQKIRAASDPSANDVLNFAEKLSGEENEASAPSLGLLQLIVLIRKAEAGADDSWTSLVNNQLRHMKAAVKLINTNPVIAMKFGNTLEGAMSLVGILKARAAEIDMENQIDDVVKPLVAKLPHQNIEGTAAFKLRADAEKLRVIK